MAQTKEKDGGKVAGVFISQQDADNFVVELADKNPELASQVRVTPVSLGEMYNIAAENEAKGKNFSLAYVPEDRSVDNAKSILTSKGEEFEGGAPLFVAKGGRDNGYLTVEQGGKQVIPFFFELSPLETLIQKFKREKPELAQNVNIETVPLEGVIETLEKNEDELLETIVLIPTEESIDFLQK